MGGRGRGGPPISLMTATPQLTTVCMYIHIAARERVVHRMAWGGGSTGVLLHYFLRGEYWRVTSLLFEYRKSIAALLCYFMSIAKVLPGYCVTLRVSKKYCHVIALL